MPLRMSIDSLTGILVGPKVLQCQSLTTYPGVAWVPYFPAD